MPKLYKSIKVEQGLRIGLREPSGSEWFADMTADKNKRTCRKIGLEYDPSSKVNKGLAEKKAKLLYKIFKEESKNKLDINGWQINTFTFSLVLLWLTGLLWISLQLMGSSEAFVRPYLLTLHGLLIAPLFIGLGGLCAAHMPKGWQPE